MVAAIHPLTPGSPAYAILKVSAVGGLIALRMVMARRSKADTPAHEPELEPDAAPDPAEPAPHPVSRRKAQRRRRRR
jgi:hypothetical protein